MSDILYLLRQVDWWSTLIAVVDIVIVAYIIYRVLLLIRGTRAAYMLIGLMVVAGVFIVAQQFALNTLRWLLDNLLNYLLLIVIIVFQADIRRGLMRMGRRMFSPTPTDEATASVEEVIELSESMVRQRVGALVVFEREVDLDELIDSGVTLDAQNSGVLLSNIFTPWPDNPLHDGAVIIRGGRIRKAAALLPLSSNPNLDRALGTRHRAGVGITEETDAVTVVVSEQRATVSICSQGLIRMGLSPAAARRELLALLVERQPKQGPFNRLGRAIGRQLRQLVEGPGGKKTMRGRRDETQTTIQSAAGRERTRSTDPTVRLPLTEQREASGEGEAPEPPEA